MKTTILLVFTFILFTQSLHGQKFSDNNSGMLKDIELTNSNSVFEKTDTIFKLFPNLDLFHKRNHKDFDLGNDKYFKDFVIVKHDPPYTASEEFPGSSIYYAKRPTMLNMPGEEKFILKPDKDSRYYLLIKDPKDGLFSQK